MSVKNALVGRLENQIKRIREEIHALEVSLVQNPNDELVKKKIRDLNRSCKTTVSLRNKMRETLPEKLPASVDPAAFEILRLKRPTCYFREKNSYGDFERPACPNPVAVQEEGRKITRFCEEHSVKCPVEGCPNLIPRYAPICYDCKDLGLKPPRANDSRVTLVAEQEYAEPEYCRRIISWG